MPAPLPAATKLGRLAGLIHTFQTRVISTAVRGMFAYTAPVQRTMAEDKAPDRSQKPVRELRAHIMAQLLGDPNAQPWPSEKTPPPPSAQMNWAYATSTGDPVRARGPVHLPLVVPRPHQRFRPNKSVDAYQWLVSHTHLISRRGSKVRRVLNNSVDPSKLVWTTRTSWRQAAKRLSLRAGNFLSGWSAADDWLQQRGARSALRAVLPKSGGNWGYKGSVDFNDSVPESAAEARLFDSDYVDAYFTNEEVPNDWAMQAYAQRIFDRKTPDELERATKLHAEYLNQAIDRLGLAD